jgi:hypothetical protein
LLLEILNRPANLLQYVRGHRTIQGPRFAVTGGAQMDAFIEPLTKLVIDAGIDRSHVFYNESLELPGYFRPTKKWDFLVVVKGQLVAALKAKSQVGPSFGNNFNNRTEEAMGSALDLWTASAKDLWHWRAPLAGLHIPSGRHAALLAFNPRERHTKETWSVLHPAGSCPDVGGLGCL